jgi:hypothetical protein
LQNEKYVITTSKKTTDSFSRQRATFIIVTYKSTDFEFKDVTRRVMLLNIITGDSPRHDGSISVKYNVAVVVKNAVPASIGARRHFRHIHHNIDALGPRLTRQCADGLKYSVQQPREAGPCTQL